MRSRFTTRPVFLGLAALTLACSTRETAPQGECRIQRILTTAESSLYSRRAETSYTYDEQGALLQKSGTETLTYTPGSIGNQQNATLETYAYDAGGYLTTSTARQTYQTTGANNQLLPLQRITTTTHTYTDEKLTGYVSTYVSSYGITTTTTGRYAYDATGALATRIETSTSTYDPAIAKEIPAPVGPERTWTYRNNRLVDYVEKAGTVETRPLTLRDGLVVSLGISGGFEGRYAYDGQQRQTKNEEYVNGKLTQYVTQTWSEAKPATDAVPGFKGFPTPLPEFGQVGVLASEDLYFINEKTATEQHYRQATATSQTNGKGFVLSTSQQINTPSSLPVTMKTTTTYTYMGCE